MSEQNNIPPFGSSGGEKLSEDKLMAYLDGKLSAAEQHDVEQWLADESMEGDAVEGLRILKTDDTRHSVSKLNHKLRHTILNKKRKRKALKTEYITWTAILIILLLAVLAYIVIRKTAQ
jgi:hypothetical protein